MIAAVSFDLLLSFSGQVHAVSMDEPACYLKTASGQTVNLNKLCGKGDASSTREAVAQEIAASQPPSPDPYRGLPDPSPYPVEGAPVFDAE